MTVFLWQHKLTYVSIPKVACTSLKHMFFEVENGHPFTAFKANGKAYHIHQFYKGINFADLPAEQIADHTRMTIVRDPLRRLLSCYSNRVLHHKELSRAKAGPKLRTAGLKPDPDLSLFLERIEDYCNAVSSIGHHARPMVDIIGHDPLYFDHIYPIERIGEFAETAGKVVGQPLVVPHKQTGGPKISPSDLTPAQVAGIRRRYAQDYDIWGRYI